MGGLPRVHATTTTFLITQARRGHGTHGHVCWRAAMIPPVTCQRLGGSNSVVEVAIPAAEADIRTSSSTRYQVGRRAAPGLKGASTCKGDNITSPSLFFFVFFLNWGARPRRTGTCVIAFYNDPRNILT